MRKKLSKIRDCLRRGLSLKIIVTGGAGFIGSEFVRQAVKKGYGIIVVDKLTYAGDLKRLEEVKGEYKFYKADICDKKRIESIFKTEKPESIVHFAAETHVDNSIVNNVEFIRSNVDGVHNLLRLIQTKSRFKMPTLLQFSTDEVYGDTESGSFTETQLMKPSNPYAATKASADMLVMAWNRTYNVPYIIVRPSNNYGIGQYIEKFIPKSIQYLSLGKCVPLHENGTPRRTWLHAQDTANAVIFLIEHGQLNEVYNISGNYEDTNLNIFKKMLSCMNIDPADYNTYVDFSVKRPGQDVRYSIDDSKLRSMGWTNTKLFDNELASIVSYHRQRFVW